MSSTALVISNASDGTGAPCTKKRVGVQNDEPLKQDLAKKFEHTLNSNGLNPNRLRWDTIDQLPPGYSAYQAPRLHDAYEDKYVAGHPNGDFLSWAAYYDHFCHLQFYGATPGCPCCKCTGNGRSTGEGLRTRVPNSIPALQIINLPQAAAPPPATAVPTVTATTTAPSASTQGFAPASFAPTLPAATAPTPGTVAFAPGLQALTAPPATALAPTINQAFQLPAQKALAAPLVQDSQGSYDGLDDTLSSDHSDEEMTDFFQPPTARGQEGARQQIIISPEDDIELIRKHARIVQEQRDIGGFNLFTPMQMMVIDWDVFIDKTLPSYGTGIYEAAGLDGKEELAERLYERLREHEEGSE